MNHPVIYILLLLTTFITISFAIPISTTTDVLARGTPHHMICSVPTWESECFSRYHDVCERGMFVNLGMQQNICEPEGCACVENRKRELQSEHEKRKNSAEDMEG